MTTKGVIFALRSIFLSILVIGALLGTIFYLKPAASDDVPPTFSIQTGSLYQGKTEVVLKPSFYYVDKTQTLDKIIDCVDEGDNWEVFATYSPGEGESEKGFYLYPSKYKNEDEGVYSVGKTDEYTLKKGTVFVLFAESKVDGSCFFDASKKADFSISSRLADTKPGWIQVIANDKDLVDSLGDTQCVDAVWVQKNAGEFEKVAKDDYEEYEFEDYYAMWLKVQCEGDAAQGTAELTVSSVSSEKVSTEKGTVNYEAAQFNIEVVSGEADLKKLFLTKKGVGQMSDISKVSVSIANGPSVDGVKSGLDKYVFDFSDPYFKLEADTTYSIRVRVSFSANAGIGSVHQFELSGPDAFESEGTLEFDTDFPVSGKEILIAQNAEGGEQAALQKIENLQVNLVGNDVRFIFDPPQVEGISAYQFEWGELGGINVGPAEVFVTLDGGKAVFLRPIADLDLHEGDNTFRVLYKVMKDGVIINSPLSDEAILNVGPGEGIGGDANDPNALGKIVVFSALQSPEEGKIDLTWALPVNLPHGAEFLGHHISYAEVPSVELGALGYHTTQIDPDDVVWWGDMLRYSVSNLTPGQQYWFKIALIYSLEDQQSVTAPDSEVQSATVKGLVVANNWAVPQNLEWRELQADWADPENPALIFPFVVSMQWDRLDAQWLDHYEVYAYEYEDLSGSPLWDWNPTPQPNPGEKPSVVVPFNNIKMNNNVEPFYMTVYAVYKPVGGLPVFSVASEPLSADAGTIIDAIN